MIGCPQAPLRGGGRRVSRPAIYPRAGAGRAARYSRAGRRAAAAATAYSATESSESSVLLGREYRYVSTGARPSSGGTVRCRTLRDAVIGCCGGSRPLQFFATLCRPVSLFAALCRPVSLRRFRCFRCLSLLRRRCRARSPRRRYRLRWRSPSPPLCCHLPSRVALCHPLPPRVAAPIPVLSMFRPVAAPLSGALFATVDAAGAYRSAKMRINLHFLSLNRIFAPRNTESGTGVVNNAVSGRIWRKTYLRIGEYRCVCASPQDDERRARGNGIPPQMFGRYIFGRRRRNVCLRNLRSHSFRSLSDRD